MQGSAQELSGFDLDDYRKMFSLTDRELKKNILDCGARQSSFNAQINKIGGNVVSVDEWYQQDFKTIEKNSKLATQNTLEFIRDNAKDYYNFDQKIDHSKKHQHALDLFLNSYEKGAKTGTYVNYDLSKMPFKDCQFDLALCSHLLFDVRGNLEIEHYQSIIEELSRIATEVRIFPLNNIHGVPYEHLGELMLDWQNKNFRIEVQETEFNSPKFGNAMLRIWNTECHI